nr:MAG TPA: hypothetical protein [Caudoviricetes sp.]
MPKTTIRVEGHDLKSDPTAQWGLSIYIPRNQEGGNHAE